MSTLCTIRGTLADFGLEPLAGATISIEAVITGIGRSDNTALLPVPMEVTTDDAGDFSFVVVPGRYRVAIAEPNSGVARAVTITVPDSDVAYLVQLVGLAAPIKLTDAQQAVIDAQTARDTANAFASIAQNMADMAAADRAAVAADRSAVTADRVTVANDRTAIAADRAGVAADRAAVDAALPALQAATATAQAAAVSAQGASTAANAAAAAAAAAAAGKVAGVGVTAIRWLTDAEYAALSPPDPATLYVHPGGLHAGAVPIAGGTVTPPAEPDPGWQITTGVGQLTVLSHPATTPPTVVSVGVGTITLS